MSDARRKTLVVGFDAACWEYLDPLLQQERLPEVRQLMDTGACGVLHSTLPAWTPTAWASLITGKNPGKHGVFGMLWRRPGTYAFSPTSARVRKGTSFWERLNAGGVRVGLVNVPFTHPPAPMDGFLVCGFGTPDSASDLAYPRDALQWIQERFGDYQPALDRALYQDGTPAQVLAAEREHQARLVDIAIGLSDECDVDVLVVNLMLLDHANHYAPSMAEVHAALGQMDVDLRRLIDGFRPDNVMLVSDHGSRRVRGDFLLYNWLLEQGYCVNIEREPAQRAAALNHLLMNWLAPARHLPQPIEKAVRGLVRAALLQLPALFTRPIWRAIERTFPTARQYVRYSDRTDYPRSRVFPESQYSGLLYFNLAQRETHGIVPHQERDALAAELTEELARLVDPDTGEALLSGIYGPEDLYAGPEVRHAPDLILDGFASSWGILSSYRELVGAGVRHRFFLERSGDLGQHSRDGVFVFSGQDFVQGTAPPDAHLMDVPATLLYLYGVPIPDDYDGRVMAKAIDPERLARRPVSYQAGDSESPEPTAASYSADEAAEVLDHLRALGYVE